MKNSYLLISVGLIILTASCNDLSVEPEYYDCFSSRQDSSDLHDKNGAFQALLDQQIKRGLPGITLMLKTPDGHVWNGAAGKADLSSGIALQTCHPMLIASVSKIFTATNVMRLYEEGKIDLDDLLAEHLEGEFMDEITNAKKVTIRQLLNHTSGLFDYLDPLAYDLNSANKPYSTDSPITKLKLAYGKKTNNEPGDTYYYSNTNFVLLGLLIEAVSGKSLAQNRKEVVFDPLGLMSAYAGTASSPTPNGIPQGYFSLHGNDVLQNSAFWYHNDLATGDGDVVISMHDLGFFLESLFKGELLDQSTVDLMIYSDELPEDWKGFYHESNGLGVEVYETPYGTAYGHLGSILGFLTIAWYWPAHDATLVYSINGLSPKILDLREKFADEIMDEMFN